MNDYTPYVAAVYVLAIAIFGGYTFRWRASWKKLQKQLDDHEQGIP
ncbi:MAG: hypothetical protein G8237_03355 [Magnetococcales bacterium]|nr:hypothetical protein [Magnetococcales bacterium]NGZ05370.1 hypothetical protein [Magnetococcales bacterium]